MRRLEADAKYSVYLDRQAEDIARYRRDDSTALPADLDYARLSGLSNEIKRKFIAIRPASLSQARRIEGVTPAALALIAAHARRAAPRAATGFRLGRTPTPPDRLLLSFLRAATRPIGNLERCRLRRPVPGQTFGLPGMTIKAGFRVSRPPARPPDPVADDRQTALRSSLFHVKQRSASRPSSPCSTAGEKRPTSSPTRLFPPCGPAISPIPRNCSPLRPKPDAGSTWAPGPDFPAS